MPEKIIYLIRHAEPEYPAGERICLGCHVDVPLSRQGRRQAEQLRDAFSDIALEAAFTSPLLRARETAQVLGRGVLPVEVVPALRELDGGVWDGLPFSELYARWPEHFHGSCRSEPPPGGERGSAPFCTRPWKTGPIAAGSSAPVPGPPTRPRCTCSPSAAGKPSV